MGNPAPSTRIKASKPDLRPKHGHSGSFSSTFVTSEDIYSRDTNVAVSAKDKRARRRTRSSLGGTEDFFKDLDFLAVSSKEILENGSLKDRPKAAPKPQATESAPRTATTAFAAESEALAPADIVKLVEGRPSQPTNTCGRAFGAKPGQGTGEGSVATTKLVNSIDNGTHLDDEDDQIGIDCGRPVSAEICPDELNEAGKAIGKMESRLGTLAIAGNVGGCQGAATEQRLQERRAQVKMSVQRRIEELDRKAKGRPVHARSQSLSLPRAFDVSHCQHHEAEAFRGLKMPLYRAPPKVEENLQVDCSELLTALQDNRFIRSLTGKAVPAHQIEPSSCHGSGAYEESRGVSHEEGQGVTQTTVPEVTKGSPAALPRPQGTRFAPDALEGKIATRELIASHLEEMAIEENTYIGATAMLAESDLPDDSNTRDAATEQEMDTATKCERSAASKAECRPEVGRVEEDPVSVVSADVGAGESPSLPESSESKATLAESRAPLESAVKGVVMEAGQLLDPPKTAPEFAISVAQPGVTSVDGGIYPPGHDLDETSVLLTKQPAVDPLFIDSQQDRLWEMHSQELTLGEEESSSCPVRGSSAHDEDDTSQYANGTPKHREGAPPSRSGIPNGTSQSDKSDKSVGKMDRPRTPLRSLLAEEEAAESGPPGSEAGGRHSGSPSTTPQNQLVSPRGNLFRRIVSGGRNSPPPPLTKTTSSKFSPKSQPAAKPFLSSCICCTPVK